MNQTQNYHPFQEYFLPPKEKHEQKVFVYTSVCLDSLLFCHSSKHIDDLGSHVIVGPVLCILPLVQNQFDF